MCRESPHILNCVNWCWEPTFELFHDILVAPAHLHDRRASRRDQCRARAPARLSLASGEVTCGALPAHAAFLWELLLHRRGAWLLCGLGGLCHCCCWYPKQLRENLDGSCSVDSFLWALWRSQDGAAAAYLPFLSSSAAFSSCWETGTAGTAT